MIERMIDTLRDAGAWTKHLVCHIRKAGTTQHRDKKGTTMNSGIPIRKTADLDRTQELCRMLIEGARGKMLGDEVLQQLASGCLTKGTYERLSRWVNPEKPEPEAMPVAEAISYELFGYRISRV